MKFIVSLPDNNIPDMKRYILIFALLGIRIILYSQTLPHDMALTKPLINTNDSSGGYYMEYFRSEFNFLYCGAMVKNKGTATASHVYLEMKVIDVSSNLLTTCYSDTIPLVNPGEQVTLHIPGQLTFQPWISASIISQLVFTVKSDSVDENPVNNQATVPFTALFPWDWTQEARSVTMTNAYTINSSGMFHSGDFIGFRISIPNGAHWMVYMKADLPSAWPDSLVMTAQVYRNGQLLTTAPFYLGYGTQPGWVFSGGFSGWPFLEADSSYYIGVEISYPLGTNFTIGADTSAYHNFAAETVARIGGTWTTLNFVPLIELICDPEGIPENSLSNTLSIYPNPARGMLSVYNTGNATLAIYDLNGKLLLTDSQPAPSRKLDISGLHAGLYVLKAISNDRILCRKFLVE